MISITDKTEIPFRYAETQTLTSTRHQTIDLLFGPTPKEWRMGVCGHRWDNLKVKSGRKGWFTFRCGYMDCDTCRRIAAREEREGLEKAGKRLYVVYTNDAAREKLTREIGIENLRWFPQQDGGLICVTTEKVEGARRLRGKDQIWWESLIHTPDGKRKTGKLGRETKETKEGDLLIQTPQWKIEGLSKKQDMEAYKAVLAADINPMDENGEVTEASLQAATFAWVERYMQEVEKRGGKLIIQQWIKERVDSSTVDWNITDSAYLETYNTDNPDELLDIYAEIDCREPES